jgi:multicomponent Na+:H+ antiporter subunit G
MNIIASILLTLGGLFLLAAAWGVARLPDPLARQHAATKAGTLALLLIALGAAFAMPDPAWLWRLAALILFLMITLPVASHLLARAALRRQPDAYPATPEVIRQAKDWLKAETPE